MCNKKDAQIFFSKNKQPDPAAGQARVKTAIFRRENTTKNMRNENGIIRVFRCLSWLRLWSLLPWERSLLRGQLLSLLCLTWLSLPFQCFIVYRGIFHLFIFFRRWHIRFLPVQEFKRCKRRIFTESERETRRGICG
jgi:hypothetical protein